MDITRNDKEVINLGKGSLPTSARIGQKPKYILPDVWMFLSYNKKVYVSLIRTWVFSSAPKWKRNKGIGIIRDLRLPIWIDILITEEI